VGNDGIFRTAMLNQQFDTDAKVKSLKNAMLATDAATCGKK